MKAVRKEIDHSLLSVVVGNTRIQNLGNTTDQRTNLGAIYDALSRPLCGSRADFGIWQHEQMAHFHRQPGVGQARAHGAILVPYLRNDIAHSPTIGFEDSIGAAVHSAALDLDQQDIPGLIDHHNVQFAVLFILGGKVLKLHPMEQAVGM